MISEKNYLLLLDSATEVCSAALGRSDGTIVAEREELTPNRHSELLALFADELLREIPGGTKAGLRAVVVSEGPGSYTGLRIGASYTKGICWSLGLPLVTIPTTEALALAFLLDPHSKRCREQYPDALLLPMIDARRMEVYAALYDGEAREIPGSGTRALVLTDERDREILAGLADHRPLLFFGNGAEKAVPVMGELFGSRAAFCPGITARSGAMLARGFERLEKGETADIGYWTPFYLKEFQATTPRKKY